MLKMAHGTSKEVVDQKEQASEMCTVIAFVRLTE